MTAIGVGRGMEVPELSKSRLTQLPLSACTVHTMMLLSGRSLRHPGVPSSLTMFNSYLAKQHNNRVTLLQILLKPKAHLDV